VREEGGGPGWAAVRGCGAVGGGKGNKGERQMSRRRRRRRRRDCAKIYVI